MIVVHDSFLVVSQVLSRVVGKRGYGMCPSCVESTGVSWKRVENLASPEMSGSEYVIQGFAWTGGKGL
jgi:hypothetical protein